MEIRKTIHANEWWFVIVDVVAARTESGSPSGYLKDIRKRDNSLAEAFKGRGQFAPSLALEKRNSNTPYLDVPKSAKRLSSDQAG